MRSESVLRITIAQVGSSCSEQEVSPKDIEPFRIYHGGYNKADFEAKKMGDGEVEMLRRDFTHCFAGGQDQVRQ